MGCEPLLPSLRTAIKRQDMGVRSDFAVRAVRASTAAMIEAPREPGAIGRGGVTQMSAARRGD